jgi:ABC-type antimicrobial peptide transport system permease subunit
MVSLNVTQRLRELAIRAALGAGRTEIVRTVLGHAARLLGAGLALGLTVAWAATRGMGSLLFQVTPADPATYGLAVIVLSASAGLACLIPLRRALRCDPAALLKA